MLRYLCILLVIAFYFVPFNEQYNGSFPEVSPNGMVVVEHKETTPYLNENAYYIEDFVNKEKPGFFSHVSSITQAGDDKMVCVWYAGSREGAKDVSIYFSINDEKKGEWTEPAILISRSQSSVELDRYIKKVGNPLVYNDNNGRLWLFYATVTVGGWSGTSINYKVSFDEGQTWTESRKMLLSPFFNLTNNVKNKGINLDDGTLVIPVYHEFIKKYSQIVRIWPGDNGIRYEISKVTSSGKAIQPSLIYDGKKNLKAFFRNMGPEENRYIFTAQSNDSGQSWSELTDTTLPNPNSGFDMIRLDSGAILGIINNSFQNRDNLTIVISHDNGKNWKTVKVLENLKDNEYSYPSISRSKKGLYHVTYTYNRLRIKHITFNDAWINKMGGSVN